jgi:hypothetical protein
MPAEHRQLSRDRDRRDVPAPACGRSQRERPQWTRRPGGHPGGLDQHMPSRRRSFFGDPTVVGVSASGLPNPRVQAEITDEMPGGQEAPNVADHRDQRRRGRDVARALLNALSGE